MEHVSCISDKGGEEEGEGGEKSTKEGEKRRGGKGREEGERGEEDRSIHYLCISTWFLPCTAHLSAAH